MPPEDEYTLALLRPLAAEGVDPAAVVRWWERERVGAEAMAPFLSRVGVFVPDAPRSLTLMRKGYLTLTGAQLLAAGGTERMRTAGNKTAPVVVAPAAAPAPATDRRVSTGSTLGRCLLVRVLGEGSCGTVYQALHQGFGVPVAVKVLNRDRDDDPAALGTLRNEARALVGLTHPNVVRVFDFDGDGPVPYLVMELVDGSNLGDLIHQCGAMQYDRAVRVIADAARGLWAAQRAGLTHRDVKPANVLVARDGTAKVTDFGLARIPAVGSGETAGFLGTFAYMAPERFDGGKGNFHSDQYGLGVTLYEAVVGHRPFRGGNPIEMMVAHVEEAVPAAHEHRPGVPAGLTTVIRRMMAKDPGDRYPSYPELIDNLAVLTSLNEDQADVPTRSLSTHPAATGRRSPGVHA